MLPSSDEEGWRAVRRGGCPREPFFRTPPFRARGEKSEIEEVLLVTCHSSLVTALTDDYPRVPHDRSS